MTIESELVALADKDEFICPQKVVEWARRHPRSDLHKSIEWDDREAAAAYRLAQVRRLIAIHVVTGEGKRYTISLVQDRHENGGYRFLDSVMKNAQLRNLALRQALAELRVWQRRYDNMKELHRVFAAADEVERDMPAQDDGAASA